MSQNFLESLSPEARLEFIDGVFDLVRNGRAEPLQEMLDSGVPVDVRNAKGDSLLIIAAYSQQNSIVTDLIDRGADKDVVNAMGQTAISCAVFRNDAAILHALLLSGANPDAGARTGLEIAEQFGLAQMAQILKEHAVTE